MKLSKARESGKRATMECLSCTKWHFITCGLFLFSSLGLVLATDNPQARTGDGNYCKNSCRAVSYIVRTYTLLCRYRIYKLKKLNIVADEIRSIQKKPCNLKVNRFSVFMFQYSEIQMKHQKTALIEYLFTVLIYQKFPPIVLCRTMKSEKNRVSSPCLCVVYVLTRALLISLNGVQLLVF